MGILFNILLPVFIVAGVVAWAQKRLEFDVQTFSKASFYVFSPAMVLDALINSDVSGAEFGQIAAVGVATALLMWGLGEVLARVLRLDTATRAAFLVAMIISNTGNYGLPVNLFAFGAPGLARAALFVTVNSMLRSSLGVYLAARGQQHSARGALREMFGVPVIYAAVVGLTLNLMGWTLPEPLLKAANILGQGLVPSSLAVLGVQMLRTFRERHEATQMPGLTVATLGKLVAAPVIAFLVSRAIGLDGLTQKVVILQSATPSAVMSLVLATEFKTNIPFAALAVLATTFGSLVTVTLWLSWLM